MKKLKHLFLATLAALIGSPAAAQLNFELNPPQCTIAGATSLNSQNCGKRVDSFLVRVTDATAKNDCTVGGGSTVNLCQFDTGSGSWEDTGGTGSGGGDNVSVNGSPAVDPSFNSTTDIVISAGGSPSSVTFDIPVDGVSLGSETLGNYVAGATANKGLTMTGTEGGTVGLQTCALNFILKSDGTNWNCAPDATGGGGGGGGSVFVDGVEVVDPNFSDNGDINFTAAAPNVTGAVKPDSVALGVDTTGFYAASDSEAGNALTGDSATAFFGTGTFEDSLVTGLNESEEVQGGGRMLNASGVTVQTDLTSGVFSAFADLLDTWQTYRFEYAPMDHGPEDFYLVDTVYNSGNLPTCNASLLHRLAVVTDACPNGDGTNSSRVCTCSITNPSTPTYAWLPNYNPPYVWKRTTSGGATGSVKLSVNDGVLHYPGQFIDFQEPTEGACQQIQYVTGGPTAYTLWGDGAFIDQALIQLGYVAETATGVDTVRAFWGYTTEPTGVVIDPTQSSPAIQNFENGWGYIFWGGTNQFYGVNKRYSLVGSGSNILALPAATSLATFTKRQCFAAGPVRNYLSTSTLAVLSLPNTSGTWDVAFRGKLGMPHLMEVHSDAASCMLGNNFEQDWRTTTAATYSPAVANYKPTVAVCYRTGGVGSLAQLRLHRMSLGVAYYDYN